MTCDLSMSLLAALSGHDLLAALGWDPAESDAWCRRVMSITDSATPAARSEIRALRGLLSDGLSGREAHTAAAEIFAKRRAALRGPAAELAQISEGGQARSDVFDSYFHMHCNRLAGRDPAVEQAARDVLAKTLHGLRVAPPW